MEDKFSNVHDMIVFAAPEIPATWDDCKTDTIMVSLWFEDTVQPAGIGLGLRRKTDSKDDILSVGLTVEETKRLIKQLQQAIPIVETEDYNALDC